MADKETQKSKNPFLDDALPEPKSLKVDELQNIAEKIAPPTGYAVLGWPKEKYLRPAGRRRVSPRYFQATPGRAETGR